MWKGVERKCWDKELEGVKSKKKSTVLVEVNLKGARGDKIGK
jgi:hypothetical protein